MTKQTKELRRRSEAESMLVRDELPSQRTNIVHDKDGDENLDGGDDDEPE